MRRIVISFSLTLVVISTVFTSCKKDELLIPSNKQEVIEENPVDNGTGENPVENSEVKIFLKSQNGLKSSTESPSEMKDGDTISFPCDINVLMYAEDQNGQPISGNWNMVAVKSDCPAGYYTSSTNQSSNEDQMMGNFTECGVYKVFFHVYTGTSSNGGLYSNIVKTFYISIEGTPGKTGDNIFRLEKKTFNNTVTGETKKLLYVYYKFSTGDSNETYAFLYKNAGTEYAPQNIKMKRWPFSKENYYYFTLEEDSTANCYAVFFFLSTAPIHGGKCDANQYLSSFLDRSENRIKFAW